ncbi:hypothetical protein WL1483_4287 [Aeromonas schubertii]|uniref:Uncharacterized protein n=1 Tax=Aeromonas schubertii TaxID=652 RepID=A0A0S2SPM5_9GAMM|nr:hypothetical protein WL1483_4287 [Aeromonas schubertii]
MQKPITNFALISQIYFQIIQLIFLVFVKYQKMTFFTLKASSAIRIFQPLE